MIAYLQGTARASDLIVTQSGVGYRVLCPHPLTVGSEVELEVVSHTARTETKLYGFSSVTECRLFRSLIALPQVGPAVALALLRELGVGGVVAATASGDAAALTKAQGVGKKVAERIVAMLQVPDVDVGMDEIPPDAEADLIGYLVELGFSQTEAQSAAAATNPTTRVEDRVAAAVRHLHTMTTSSSRHLERTA